MDERKIAALRNLTVIDGGANVKLEVVDETGASQGYEMSISILTRSMMVLQTICKDAISKLQERPGFDERLYSVPFDLVGARTAKVSSPAGGLRILVQMKSSTGLVIDLALPKDQALQLAAQLQAQAAAPDPIPRKLS